MAVLQCVGKNHSFSLKIITAILFCGKDNQFKDVLFLHPKVDKIYEIKQSITTGFFPVKNVGKNFGE